MTYLFTIHALQHAKYRVWFHDSYGLKCIKHQLSRKFRQMQRSMSHPHLALSNEVVLITPGVFTLLCCFCLIKLNLQLSWSNLGVGSTMVLPICLPVCVFEIISHWERPGFQFMLFSSSVSPHVASFCSARQLASPVSLIIHLPFAFKYFLPHSCSAQPDCRKQILNVCVTELQGGCFSEWLVPQMGGVRG